MTYTANHIIGVRVSDKLLVARIEINWTTRRRNTAAALRREMTIGSIKIKDSGDLLIALGNKCSWKNVNASLQYTFRQYKSGTRMKIRGFVIIGR